MLERERAWDQAQRRIAALERALKIAAPYVQTFAENAPHDDGGAEAVADLAKISAALKS